jgi:hypothetical protein
VEPLVCCFPTDSGVFEAKSDTSLFIYHHGAETVYLLLYVDDIVLTASSESLLRRIIASSVFLMKQPLILEEL